MSPSVLEPSSSPWRFEALDALAGTAFASRVGTSDAEDSEVIYLRPPTFDIEPMGRSSIALGAMRGSFQGGLVIDEREATFPNLDALREFVRRGYISGSGGGGEPDNQGGGGPPPPEPSSPDDLAPPDLRGDRIGGEMESLGQDLVRLKEQIAHCRPGDAIPIQWSPAGAPFAGEADRDALAYGAFLVATDFFRSKSAGLTASDEAVMHALALMIWHVGVDPEELFDRFAHEVPLTFRLPFADFYRFVRYRDHWPAYWHQVESLDLLERLSGPPVPGATGSVANINLLTWFTRFMACPVDALNSLSLRQALGRAIVAAAVIVWRPPAFPPYADWQERGNLLARLAFAWLRAQLPMIAFAPRFEAAIADVGRRR